jgi:hypothetical protein
MHLQRPPLRGLSERVEKHVAADVVLEDVPMIRAAVHYVMPRTRKIGSGRMGHDARSPWKR